MIYNLSLKILFYIYSNSSNVYKIISYIYNDPKIYQLVLVLRISWTYSISIVLCPLYSFYVSRSESLKIFLFSKNCIFLSHPLTLSLSCCTSVLSPFFPLLCDHSSLNFRLCLSHCFVFFSSFPTLMYSKSLSDFHSTFMVHRPQLTQLHKDLLPPSHHRRLFP